MDNPTATGGVDLHAHTTASDGTLTPTQLIYKAQENGLAALAVTDHDTIGGLQEAAQAANDAGIDFVPGVELSVEDDAGRFHMLGLLLDSDNAALRDTLVEIRKSRAARNTLMADRMKELNLPVTMDDVQAEAGEDAQVVARPHFARALIKKGVVSTVQEAFDQYLATGKPLYLPKQVLTPAQAVALIHNAGGLALMAHPGLVPLSDDAFAARVESLAADAGLDGLEAYYSQHSPAQTERFLELARRLGLAVSGGSDFHGSPKPHIELGTVYQGGPTPHTVLDDLRARAAR